MPDQSASVQALLAAARDGDPSARNALLGRYRAYLALVARMAMRRSLRAKFDASDVVQEALVRAQRGLGDFRGGTEEELVAWLRRILARTLSNANRTFHAGGRDVGRERSLEELLHASSHALSALPPGGETSPSRGAERREAGALVADVLAALKDDDCEVITLRSLEERTWAEVAAVMGRSEEAVRALWGRAIQRFGTEIAQRERASRA